MIGFSHIENAVKETLFGRSTGSRRHRLSVLAADALWGTLLRRMPEQGRAYGAVRSRQSHRAGAALLHGLSAGVDNRLCICGHAYERSCFCVEGTVNPCGWYRGRGLDIRPEMQLELCFGAFLCIRTSRREMSAEADGRPEGRRRARKGEDDGKYYQ